MDAGIVIHVKHVRINVQSLNQHKFDLNSMVIEVSKTEFETTIC
jgi:hypothetical protein